MPLWLVRRSLVLASKSEIRSKILAAAGLRFEVHPAQIDERAVEVQARSEDAKDVAVVLARTKAQAVAENMIDCLVLGADQTLALGHERFSKAMNRDDATVQLRKLRGKSHTLYSALALVCNGNILFECVETAQLTMRDFSDRFLEDYLDMAGPAAQNSVGAYQFEGLGVHLFERINGDYFTILGLPLMPLLAYFRDQGFVNA